MQGIRKFPGILMLVLFLSLFSIAISPARALNSLPPVAPVVFNDCFNAAGVRYQIDPLLLKSIVKGESSFNPRATNTNKDKDGKVSSRDYGLMQINSTHIPKLVRMGVIQGAEDLLNRPCLNIQIGAWILANHFQVCGVTWNCLGSYNAGFREDRHETREHYANRIWQNYQELRGLIICRRIKGVQTCVPS